MKTRWICPVCGGDSDLIDVVDFNKSCEEARGKFLGMSGVPIYYAICSACDFCFAPEMRTWNANEVAGRIYNADYILVDPDYAQTRPRANAAFLESAFPIRSNDFRHIDYASGSGLLTSLLRDSGWHSSAFDPFLQGKPSADHLGKFHLVTAFEVFEHVPDPHALMLDLSGLLAPDGVILLSTLLSDGHVHRNRRLDWWYAAPRNGHISLFSAKSLAILARDSGFRLTSLSGGLHLLFTNLPGWACQRQGAGLSI